MHTISIGKTYRYYRGETYQVIAIRRDSENPENLRVIYQGLYLYEYSSLNVIIDDKGHPRFAEVQV